MAREPGLVFLDRSRLRAAQLSGHLDADTAGWAEGVMDLTGIPDGLPVITLGETVFEPGWRWQRSAPQAQAAATRMRYMRDVRRLVAFLEARGVMIERTTGTDLRAFAQERRSATSAATWAVEEAALMSFFRFCSGEGPDGWRVFDRDPWPLWRTARSDRSALRRPADTLPATPRFWVEYGQALNLTMAALAFADGTLPGVVLPKPILPDPIDAAQRQALADGPGSTRF